MSYAGRNVLVIGLARTGLSAAQLLDGLGAKITVTDLKPESELKGFANLLPGGVRKILGGSDGVSLADYDLAVISPGVAWDSPLPVALRDRKITIISEIELAFTLLNTPIIAVTGANGKTTTTTLIGQMLKSAGYSTYVGGNIGAPLCSAVGGGYEWVVAEISSFQLEGIKTFRPRIGLILNITPDHLDRHKTMDVYARLKRRLFENQADGDTLILNAGDERVNSLRPALGVATLRFGVTAHGCDGAWVEDGRAVALIDSKKSLLFDVADLKTPGLHNLENALSASIAALNAGVDPAVIKKVIRGFQGLPNRMEKVAVVDGVTFINDSKGTNPAASAKSLSGFSSDVVIIAGGSDKGGDFAEFSTAVKRHAKAVLLMGVTADRIEQSLGSFSPIKKVVDMDTAVRRAFDLCSAGDTVLLSPACASFDMYENYEERGMAFKDAVARLQTRGERCR